MMWKGSDMNKATVDSPDSEQTQAWWFLDTLVIEHRCAPDMETVVMEMTLPVGSSPPLHVHDSLDDTWYILDGEMVIHCGDETHAVGAGHWVSMPRGVPHTFHVVGDRPARILLVHDNASFRDLIRDLGVPAAAPLFLSRECSRRWTSSPASPPSTTSRPWDHRSAPRMPLRCWFEEGEGNVHLCLRTTAHRVAGRAPRGFRPPIYRTRPGPSDTDARNPEP